MADYWPDEQLSCDDFLGGGVRCYQPRQGYRAGIDPVLLAASVPAKPGDSILELGCGAGVASLCLGRRVEGLTISGLEVQAPYVDLARRNAEINGVNFDVYHGDLSQMPDPLQQMQFTHVLTNPPYFDRANSTPSADAVREMALGERALLSDWVGAAARRTAPKGYVTFIQRAERLPELLLEFQKRLGSLRLLPLIPRRGRAARLFILQGRKGGRADFRLCDGWVLHDGDAHIRDEESYTKSTSCILRGGEALPM